MSSHCSTGVEGLEARVVLASTAASVIEIGMGPAVMPVATVADRDGNLYVAGTFDGVVDFNPRRNQTHLVDGGQTSSFVARYGAAGGLDWVVALRYDGELSGIPEISSLATDARGDVYVAGGFTGRPTFDAASGAWRVPAPTLDQPLSTLWKFHRDGTFSFANTVARVANHSQRASHVAVDRYGSIYTTENDVDFTNGSDHFTTSSYLKKWSSGGREVWTAGVDGTYPHVLAIDRHANPWVLSTHETSGRPDVHVATKYNGRGRFLDAVPVATSTVGLGSGGVAFDAEDDLIVAGGFTGVWDFDPGAGERLLGPKRTGSGYSSVFLTKIRPDHTLVFAHTIGGAFYDMATGVSVEPSGVIHVSGSFGGVADFDPSAAGRFLLEALGPNEGTAQDLFTASYDASGRFLSASSLPRERTLESDTAAAFVRCGAAVLGQSVRGADERSIVLWLTGSLD